MKALEAFASTNSAIFAFFFFLKNTFEKFEKRKKKRNFFKKKLNTSKKNSNEYEDLFFSIQEKHFVSNLPKEKQKVPNFPMYTKLPIEPIRLHNLPSNLQHNHSKEKQSKKKHSKYSTFYSFLHFKIFKPFLQKKNIFKKRGKEQI